MLKSSICILDTRPMSRYLLHRSFKHSIAQVSNICWKRPTITTSGFVDHVASVAALVLCIVSGALLVSVTLH